jgi:lipopolysaccharide biosynthesis protein
MTKRLFLFAGYDKDGIVDDSDLIYLRALSKLGDIIFVADSVYIDGEIEKVREIPNIINIEAKRHGEYDFGSYKRAYNYAVSNGLLNNYDWVYLVNDSVFGPLKPLEPILCDLENRGAGAIGLSYAIRRRGHPRYDEFPEYLQSFFVGLTRDVAASDYFAEFITGIKKHYDKMSLFFATEFMLTKVLKDNNVKIDALYTVPEGDDIFRAPLKMLTDGFPFIKKSQDAMRSLKSISDLAPFVKDYNIEIIKDYLERYNIRFGSFRLIKTIRLFKIIPIVKVYRANHSFVKTDKYYIFGIQLFRITYLDDK